MSLLKTLSKHFGKKPVKSAAKHHSTKQNQKLENRYPANLGYRPDCPEIKKPFRSSMEANTYRYLRYLKNKHGRIVSIEYEPERFTFRTNKYNIHSYIPDFKITTVTGVRYIEVKGVVDRLSITKTALLKKDYHWIKIYYLLPNFYESIREKYKNIIPEWE